MNRLLLCLPLMCLLLVSAGVAQDRCALLDDAILGATAPAAFDKPGPPRVMSAWSTAQPIPVPKQYHTVASLNGDVYVFGGVTTGNYYNAKSYKYSSTSNTWTAIKDFPVGRFLFGLAQAVNGRIYIFGGLDNLGGSYKVVPDVYEYDPAADTYTKKTGMPLAQGFSASVVIDNKIYVIAGSGSTNTTFVKRVQVYDPATDSWSTATDYPRDVRYLSAATVNNTAVVTGGYNNTYTGMYYIADTYIGTVSGGTLQWTKVKDYPIGPTIYMSGVGIGSRAYFFGGRPSIDNNAPATQRSFMYDPQTDAWSVLELKPTGMQAVCQAATDGKKAYIPGGQDKDGNPLDEMEIFDSEAEAGPVLFLTTTSYDLWVKRSQPVSVSFPIQNNGTGALTWQASVNTGSTDWLSLSKTSGTVLPMSGDVLTLQINAGGIAAGEYSGGFTLTTNDAAKQSVTIPVAIHAQDADVDTELEAFIEEFSGTWCGWCPDGVDSLHVLEAQFGDRINVVTYHSGDAMEIPAGTQLIDTLHVPGFPSAAINRILFPGQTRIPIYRDYWRPFVANLLATKRSPVSISIADKSYNPATRALRFTVNVFAHQTVPGALYLEVIEVEDSINYTQTRYNPTRYVNPYYHENVVKLMVPDAVGMPISTSNFVTQTSISKEFSFTSADSVAAHASIVVIVHRFNGAQPGEVLQSHRETILANATAVDPQPAPTGYALAQNYPNPFNPSTTITYAVPRAGAVVLTVSDALGRTIETLVRGNVEAGRHSVVFDAKALPSGMYYLMMRAGGFTQTRAMTLVK